MSHNRSSSTIYYTLSFSHLEYGFGLRIPLMILPLRLIGIMTVSCGSWWCNSSGDLSINDYLPLQANTHCETVQYIHVSPMYTHMCIELDSTDSKLPTEHMSTLPQAKTMYIHIVNIPNSSQHCCKHLQCGWTLQHKPFCRGTSTHSNPSRCLN